MAMEVCRPRAPKAENVVCRAIRYQKRRKSDAAWHLTAIVIKFSAESGVERHRCSAQADMAKPFLRLEFLCVSKKRSSYFVV